MISNTK